jgi:hypothetical protein
MNVFQELAYMLRTSDLVVSARTFLWVCSTTYTPGPHSLVTESMRLRNF